MPRMSLLSARTVLLLPALLALAGCTTVDLGEEGESLLAPPCMPSDSCTLDVFFVRCEFGDPQSNEELWQAVDEQHFSPELRQRLQANGFRVGVVGGQVPVALSELLELGNKPPPTGGANQVSIADLQEEPRVTRSHLSIRSGLRKEIVASSIYDQLTAIVCESGQLGGQTYAKAQAVLAVKTFPLGDGRVRLELVPELHYGEPRKRWVGSQGMWRLEPGRPRRVFDQMALSATLSPGSMLVLTSLPRLPGSLGHHFFTTEENGRLRQKLLVVRLSQTQHDGLFSPPEALNLDP